LGHLPERVGRDGSGVLHLHGIAQARMDAVDVG
jgi:hypothetical protein